MSKDGWAMLVFAIIVFGVLFGNLYQFIQSQKTEIIEGKVIDVDLSPERYMIVTFDNGDVYHISTKGYMVDRAIDFTVNSRMMIKLEYSSWWITPNTDDVWSIIQLVKVPSEV